MIPGEFQARERETSRCYHVDTVEIERMSTGVGQKNEVLGLGVPPREVGQQITPFHGMLDHKLLLSRVTFANAAWLDPIRGVDASGQGHLVVESTFVIDVVALCARRVACHVVVVLLCKSENVAEIALTTNCLTYLPKWSL